MEAMLAKAADYYEKELDNGLKISRQLLASHDGHDGYHRLHYCGCRAVANIWSGGTISINRVEACNLLNRQLLFKH